jgi:hypothetical protein
MPTPACAAGATPFRIIPWAGVDVSARRAFAITSKADADLRASLVFLRKHFADVADSLEPYVRPGVLFVSAYDACRAEAQILVDPDRALAAASGQWVTLEVADLPAPGVRLVKRIALSSASDERSRFAHTATH